VIATGTPSGIGAMWRGDTIEIKIEGGETCGMMCGELIFVRIKNPPYFGVDVKKIYIC
jgi:2-keto-4-pentenoate hydratase/2-oxohepta-3-ene-1,7-dioic acid hydratase in catechol pathway